METPQPPQAPQVTPPRKGLHPLAWAGIGCGGLVVVAIIVVAVLFGMAKRKIKEVQDDLASDPHRTAAELIVRMNPDVEMIGEDEEAGEMTIRVKSSGEEITVSYDDLAEGKFTVKNSDGTVTTVGGVDDSKIPAWVPRYPDMLAQTAGYHQETATGGKGVIVYTTNDSAEIVADFYEDEMDGASGTSNSSMSIGSTTKVTRSFSDGGKKLEVTAASTAGTPTQVQVTYEE